MKSTEFSISDFSDNLPSDINTNNTDTNINNTNINNNKDKNININKDKNYKECINKYEKIIFDLNLKLHNFQQQKTKSLKVTKILKTPSKILNSSLTLNNNIFNLNYLIEAHNTNYSSFIAFYSSHQKFLLTKLNKKFFSSQFLKFFWVFAEIEIVFNKFFHKTLNRCLNNFNREECKIFINIVNNLKRRGKFEGKIFKHRKKLKYLLTIFNYYLLFFLLTIFN